MPEQNKKPAVVVPHGFVLCAFGPATKPSEPASWQQQLYRHAYEKAVAATQVPRHYRRFTNWN